MNFNTFQYRYARNALAVARSQSELYGDRPLCSLSNGEYDLYVSAEERVREIPKFIDRLRWLAKNDRSRYTPHIGAKQRSKCDNRSVCCLPEGLQ